MVAGRIITEEEGKKYKIYNASCPRIYGNPKIHKNNRPLRPIVSSIQLPTTSIATIVTKILNKGYDTDNAYHTGDTFQFTEFMKNKIIPATHRVSDLTGRSQLVWEYNKRVND